MDTPLYRRLDVILTADAAANLALAVTVAVAAAAGLLAPPLGLAAPWPLYAAAGVMALYGLEQGLAARTEPVGRRPVIAFVAVDAVVGAGLVALAVADPSAAETWARWGLAVVGDVVLLVGALKAHALRRAPTTARPSTGPAASA